MAEYWLLIISANRLSQALDPEVVPQLRRCADLNQHLAQGSYDKVYIHQWIGDALSVWDKANGWTEVPRCPSQ